MTYDWADDARKSYDLAIKTLRQEFLRKQQEDAMKQDVAIKTARRADGTPIKFDPRKTKIMVPALKAAAAQAARIQDWATSDATIDELIDWIAAFCAWWHSVTPPNGRHKCADHLTEEQKTELTAIHRNQVRRWDESLEDRIYFKLHLRSSLQRAAFSGGAPKDDGELYVVDPKKYQCLVIDPPWPMNKIERSVRPRQHGFDYPTMTIDELGDLKCPKWHGTPPPELAAEKCHLYLWTTHKFLPDAYRLSMIWGFKYECVMTWVKNNGFTPFSWMYSTEHVLFCKRGNGPPLLRKGLRLDFTGKVREHSRKPEEFYELVRQASPGPRLDMFSREPHEGFDQWGNEDAAARCAEMQEIARGEVNA